MQIVAMSNKISDRGYGKESIGKKDKNQTKRVSKSSVPVPLVVANGAIAFVCDLI